MTHARQPDSLDAAKESFAAFLAQRRRPDAISYEDWRRAHVELAESLDRVRREYDETAALLGHFDSLESSDAHAGASLNDLLGVDVDPAIELHSTSDALHDASDDAADREAADADLPDYAIGLRLLKRIGAGGMGAVYLARDPALRRNVAVKTIRSEFERQDASGRVHYDRQRLWRFLEEAQITGQLEHPGIVPVHELGVDRSGRVYFTMKRVQGRTLEQLFGECNAGSGDWSEQRLLRDVFLRVCDALAFAHQKGVVHRDLKPDNIMVGEFGEVYVMDWGLARVVARAEAAEIESARFERRAQEPNARLESTNGRGVGYPAYTAPEQARGDWSAIDERTDVYAVGAMLYQLLARRRPYSDGADGVEPSFDFVAARAPTPIEVLAPNAAPELRTVCRVAMSRRPDDRYSTIAQLAADLRAYLEHRVVARHATGPLVSVRKWVDRNPIAARVLAIAGAVVVCGAIGMLLLQLRYRTDLDALKREKLDNALLATARLAEQRGDWAALLDSALDLGDSRVVGSFERDLLTATAFIESGHSAWASQILEPLDDARLNSPQKGRRLLLLAEAEQRPDGDADRASTYLRAALDDQLDTSNRAYAEGMLAESSLDALNCFDEAVAENPSHRGALEARLATSFFLGRLDEARADARALAATYPADPSPAIFLMLCDGFAGRLDDARRTIAAMSRMLSREKQEEFAFLLSAIAAFNRVSSDSFISGSTAELQVALGSAIAAARAGGRQIVDQDGSSPLIPRVPSVANAYAELAHDFLPKVGIGDGSLGAAITAALVKLPIESEPAECALRIGRAADAHPEGFVCLMHGIALITSPLRAGQTQADKLRDALGAFERSVDAGHLIPKMRDVARYMAMKCYVELIPGSNDLGLAARARRMILDIHVDEFSDWKCVNLAMNCALSASDADQSLRLVDEWLARHPLDVDAQASRCNVLRVLGAVDAALQTANALLAEHPKNAALVNAQKLAAQAVDSRNQKSGR